jgi:hypothetical protein
VDLSTAQGSIGGAKTFTSTVGVNGILSGNNSINAFETSDATNTNGAAPNPLISVFSNVTALGTGDAYGQTLYHDGTGYGLGSVVGTGTRGFPFLTYTAGSYPATQAGFTRVAWIDATGRIEGRSDGSTLGYVPPAYLASGAITANTMHCVVDKVTAGGASTTVTLSGAAAFSSANYAVFIENDTTFALVAPTAQAAGSFSFVSVNTTVYAFTACGA